MSLHRVSKILSFGRLMGFVLSEDSIGCPDLGIDLFEVECDPSQRWLLEFDCVFHDTWAMLTRDYLNNLLKGKLGIVTCGIESSFKKYSNDEYLYQRTLSNCWIWFHWFWKFICLWNKYRDERNNINWGRFPKLVKFSDQLT